MLILYTCLYMSQRLRRIDRLMGVKRPGLGVLCMLLLLGVGTWYLVSRSDDALQKDPTVGMAIEANTLEAAVTKLKDSLYSDAGPAETTSEYLDHLESINTSCARISDYNSASKGMEPAHISHTNQTVAICRDLTKLSGASSSIFSAVEPLLTASTKPRRFQTLSPVANRTRGNHKSVVNEAQEDIRKINLKEVDYPFAASAELQTLEQAIDDSKGLDYLPALRKFQLQILGERQQYWVTYADIESLQRSLKVQGDGFCQALNTKQTVSECKKP